MIERKLEVPAPKTAANGGTKENSNATAAPPASVAMAIVLNRFLTLRSYLIRINAESCIIVNETKVALETSALVINEIGIATATEATEAKITHKSGRFILLKILLNE